MSAPASAWDTATLDKNFNVLSFNISNPKSVSSFSTIKPQWPWEVYWQRQTSVITIKSVSCLSSLTAFWTIPFSANAGVPTLSFSSFKGTPKTIMDLRPNSSRCLANSTPSSREYLN